MKTITVYELKDLSSEVQSAVKARAIDRVVEDLLNGLTTSLDGGLITEEEFYHIIGCSKAYAESTAWFVPACYYEHNEAEVEEEVKDYVNSSLYTMTGVELPIYLFDVELYQTVA